MGGDSEEFELDAAAAVIRARGASCPLVGLILGSGLGYLADEVAAPTTVRFAEIPRHPVASVEGHAGRIVLGRLAGTAVAVWSGRIHFYEGLTMQAVTFPVRLLRALGARIVILTNAAGALNEAFAPGDLMLITDHLNFPGLAGHSPLRGIRSAPANDRFVDMADAYDPELRQIAREAAQELGQPLRQGVYVMVSGPSYETPAEARMLRLLGADAVGMSTAPEVVAARQVGLRVLAFSAITNSLQGPANVGTSHLEVLATAEQMRPRFSALLRGVLTRLGTLPSL